MIGKRDITVGKHSGFCFGVSRAAETVEGLVAEAKNGERIFTLGKLIHNDVYNSRLAEKGVLAVSEADLDEIAAISDGGEKVTVVLRAHGVTAGCENKLLQLSLEHLNFRFIDCTCPSVKKIHRIVEQYSGEEYALALLGHEGHPETDGIISRFLGEKIVFSDSCELESAAKRGDLEKIIKKTVICIAQTTQNVTEFKKSKKILKYLCTKPIFFDTICNVTESRQKEADIMSRECDKMIVIGGKESSNTSKLYQICKSNCKDTVWIESADELTDVPTSRKTGIVAGASTPPDIIEEVYKTMSATKENFAQMLEDQPLKTLNTGDVVTGTVEYVSDTELQLDLGAGVTGLIKAEQITDDSSVKLKELYKQGDTIEAFVIRVSDVEGYAELSKKRADADKNRSRVLEAKTTGEMLSGKVVEAVKGGVVVSVDSVRVFVPASQTGVPKDGDLHSIVGTTVKLYIIDVRDDKRAVGSIKQVLREERRAAEEAFWQNLEEGKEFTGKIKSMTSYGAFVDLGGVDGMVHVSELSWKHIKNPAEVVAVGDEITVFVKSFDAEKKRISLGHKTEATNPWNIFTTNYSEGDTASVKIVSLTTFGAFAEIVDGVDGLIHISQLANKRVAQPSEVLEVGQTVDAKIIAIDGEKKKVSLSIRALLEPEVAPEAAEEAVEEATEEAAE